MDTFEGRLTDAIGPLLRFAFRLAGDHDRAEDLVQEACTRAVEARERVRDAGELRPYLFKILHNVWVDWCRSAHRGPQILSLDADDDTSPLPPLCASDADLDALRRGGVSDEVEAALATLDETWRETLWLRSVEGFSYAQIAEITEVPVGTVRSRLARARRALAKRLRVYAEREGALRRASGKE
jgi:RNA polymerase sigma-70 factor (ECF subfamily)